MTSKLSHDFHTCRIVNATLNTFVVCVTNLECGPTSLFPFPRVYAGRFRLSCRELIISYHFFFLVVYKKPQRTCQQMWENQPAATGCRGTERLARARGASRATFLTDPHSPSCAERSDPFDETDCFFFFKDECEFSYSTSFLHSNRLRRACCAHSRGGERRRKRAAARSLCSEERFLLMV